jgi:carboxymethylenebutenolidase
MAIKGEWVRYGDQIGYFAVPERARYPLPGVVVIQEVGGVNEQIKDVTRRIAASGYAALAPDLFAVDGERPACFSDERIAEAFAFMNRLPPAARLDPAARQSEMAKLPEDERARVSETFARIFSSPQSAPAHLASLRRAVDHLRRERPESAGRRVGCVGFCMGGSLSALLACEEPELSAAAVFYGNSPPSEKVAGIRCPVIGFYGGLDQRVNAGLTAFEDAMKAAGKDFEHKVYEGANHAFFNDDAPVYDAEASRDSFARLLGFFAARLTP